VHTSAATTESTTFTSLHARARDDVSGLMKRDCRSRRHRRRRKRHIRVLQQQWRRKEIREKQKIREKFKGPQTPHVGHIFPL